MEINKIKVYIASPYSLGDKLNNVRNSLSVSNELINRGFVPIAPLLFHFQDMIFPQEYDKWLEICRVILTTADCILRLPGESFGANIEVQDGIKLGLPVFYSLEELYKHYNLN